MYMYVTDSACDLIEHEEGRDDRSVGESAIGHIGEDDGTVRTYRG